MAGITRALSGIGFELRRSWPRSADQLLLDLQPIQDASGKPVAGQWFRDPYRARSTAASTPGATCAGRVRSSSRAVRTEKLVPLSDLLQDPRTELVSHRPERRAVLRHHGEGNHRYSKVVAVKKHQTLERATRLAQALPVRTPRVHSTDPTRGTVTTEALPGRTLHDLLTGPRARPPAPPPGLHWRPCTESRHHRACRSTAGSRNRRSRRSGRSTPPPIRRHSGRPGHTTTYPRRRASVPPGL